MASIDFVGVDWGTSSFRAWRCGADNQDQLLHKSDTGMSRLKPGEFAPYLDRVLRENDVAETTLVVICGMAGARDGGTVLPYASAPASSLAVGQRAVSVKAGPYSCRILPGVSLVQDGRFDVMRGEETLLFGALSQGHGDGLYCLPGTHSKWCQIENGRLTHWRTGMTGELFALLSSQSTLSGFCSSGASDVHNRPEFASAVHDVLIGARSVMQDLFTIRARALLDPDAEDYSFSAQLSGLLIGQEIAGLGLDGTPDVILISGGPIRDVYCAALSIAGMNVRTVEAEDAALAG